MTTSNLDLKDMIALFLRQRRLILTTLAIFLGAALIYILSATPIYRATVTLMAASRDQGVMESDSVGYAQAAIVNSRIESEVEILKKPSTALAVIAEGKLLRDPQFGPKVGWSERLGMALGFDPESGGIARIFGFSAKEQDPTELVQQATTKLLDTLKVRRVGLSFLYELSIDSSDPKRAAEIANLYAKVYIDRQVASKSAAASNARDVLRRQIQTTQEQLASSEAAVNAFVDSNLGRLEQESGDPQIKALRQALELVKSEKASENSRLAAATSAINGQNWEDVAESLQDDALTALASQRKEVESRLQDAVAGSQEAIDLKAELSQLEDQLKSRSDATLAEIQAGLQDKSKRETEAMQQLREALLQSDLSEDMLAELFDLQQTATVVRNQYQALIVREQTLGNLANMQIADSQIVSEATPPTYPSSPNKRLALTAAAVAGLLLGTLLAFVKEFYVGGVVSALQLRNIIEAKVPVSIPQVSGDSGSLPLDGVITTPMSAYAETFRKLRATIDNAYRNALAARQAEGEGVASQSGHSTAHSHGGKRAMIILVGSAIPAEGKTTTTIALARTYALAGMKTLLIDADLRKPAVASRLGLGNPDGLIDYLGMEENTEELSLPLCNDPLSTLKVLPAGERSSVPTDQMINSRAFEALIETAAQRYDVVLLDSPPILPVVDTRYLARFADVFLHVVRFSSTTQGEVREAATQIAEVLPHRTVVFGVLSHEEQARSSYGYYGRYGGYYGQDEA